MAHKDFDNIRYNKVYTIVVDDKTQLKNKYDLNIIYANEGKLYRMSKSYAEMSKLFYIYQLYKNGTISSKYIGLNHYRRYFIFGDNIPKLENIFKNYDIILNKPIKMEKNVKNHYCLYHFCKHFDEILNIIKEIKPDYYITAKRTSMDKKMFIGNLFIMKKEDFFKYCEFMFDILFEFDRKKNFSSDIDVLLYLNKIYNNSYESYAQRRIQGFLSERISNIFFHHYFKNIKYFDIE